MSHVSYCWVRREEVNLLFSKQFKSSPTRSAAYPFGVVVHPLRDNLDAQLTRHPADMASPSSQQHFISFFNILIALHVTYGFRCNIPSVSNLFLGRVNAGNKLC